MSLRDFFVAFILAFSGVALAFTSQDSAAEPSPGWPQWGGPNRDFKAGSTGLAEAWPEEGPPMLWRRPLGEGYSTVVAEDETLYTMYRHSTGEREGQEVVVALDAGSGQTRWGIDTRSLFRRR